MVCPAKSKDSGFAYGGNTCEAPAALLPRASCQEKETIGQRRNCNCKNAVFWEGPEVRRKNQGLPECARSARHHTSAGSGRIVDSMSATVFITDWPGRPKVLTDEQEFQVFDLCTQGVSRGELTRQFACSCQVISLAILRVVDPEHHKVRRARPVLGPLLEAC